MQLKSNNATVETLYEAVQEAWSNYDSGTWSNYDSGHQFACYLSILTDEGGNWYEAPNSGIRTGQSHGIKVMDLKVDRELITQAQQLVRDYFGNEE